MVSLRRAWGLSPGVDQVRRDSLEPGSSAQCYAPCNSVTKEAQVTGKDPSLCAVDSQFQRSMSECEMCIFRYSNYCLSDLPDELLPLTQYYVDYCKNVTSPDGTGNLEGNAQNIYSLIRKNACLRSTVEDLRSSLSHQSTVVTPAATSARSSPPPPTPSDGNKGAHPVSIAHTVVPAVVAPVVAVCVAFGILAYFLWRWRQRLQAKQAGMLEGSVGPSEFGPKAELPTDKDQSELDGVGTDAGSGETKEMDNNEVAELPAREVVGVEMDASGRHG